MNEKAEELREMALMIVGKALVYFVCFFIAIFLFQWVWAKLMPRFLPTLVNAGIIPATLTTAQTIKTCLLLVVLGMGRLPLDDEDGEETFGWRLFMIFAKVGFFFLAVVLTMILWNWAIPDIFSRAVEMQLLPAKLSFIQALLLKLLLLFSGVLR
ncbi:MAG: hypothetical protein ACPLKP_00770 [Microgenomates group bacterium]